MSTSCLGGLSRSFRGSSATPFNGDAGIAQRKTFRLPVQKSELSRFFPAKKEVIESKGIFTPVMVIARNVIGNERFNLLRGKSGLHFQRFRCPTTKFRPTFPYEWLRLSAVACCLHPALSILQVSPAAAADMKGVPASSVKSGLDPETAKLLIGFAGPFLSTFGFLFILRIIMSWYPKLPVGKFPYVIAYAPTEPFLLVTRKVIPPLGGVDVTPVVWFGLVSFLNEILVGPQGLLVLLSQKV